MNRKTHRRFGMGSALLIILVVTAGILLSSYASRSPAVAVTQLTDRQKLTQTLSNYMQSVPQASDWWLTKLPESPEKSLSLMTNALAIITNSLNQTKAASPLAHKVVEAFPNFFTTVFYHGASMATVQGEAKEDLVRKQEVCFITAEDFRKGDFPTSLFYRRDWGAVMMAGQNWPNPYFASVLMHELGHAYRHKVEGHSEPMFSREWITEEVEMHELQAQVLSHGTSGAYSNTIDRIIDQYPGAQTPAQLLASVTSNDLLVLDSLIGTGKEGRAIRGATVAEHIAILGFRFIDRKGGKLDDKIDHYSWINTNVRRVSK